MMLSLVIRKMTHFIKFMKIQVMKCRFWYGEKEIEKHQEKMKRDICKISKRLEKAKLN